MVISGGNFKPDTLKPKEVVSLLLDDEEIEAKCKWMLVFSFYSKTYVRKESVEAIRHPDRSNGRRLFFFSEMKSKPTATPIGYRFLFILLFSSSLPIIDLEKAVEVKI